MYKKKAILFDLGDIFFEAHFWRKWNYDYLVMKGLFTGDFFAFYNYYEKFLKSAYEGKKIYVNAFDDFVQSLDLENSEEFKKKSLEVKNKFEKERELFPNVLNTLSELKKRKIDSIVVSDNESSGEMLRKTILNNFGLANLVNKVYTSKDLHCTKPSAEFFNNVLSDLGLNVKDVIFVAHDKDEINGAIKLGIDTIEFNNYLGVDTDASVRIKNFEEILTFCK